MSETHFIKRKNPDSYNRYQQLKEQGFAAVQKLSGDHWTDFNAHDPGVTILESLCYGISDLIYRSEFSVADMLARDEEGIDYQSSALHMPEQAFSCRATTADDYRKLILDQICDIDDAWVIPCDPDTTNGISGLYRILLQLSQTGHCFSGDEVAQRVKQIFTANRNLGEDLFAVEIIEAQTCTLHAKIEIESLIQPADLLAAIYAVAYRYVSDGVKLESYDALASQDKPLDQVFDGPYTRHGYIHDQAHLAPGDKVVHVADFYKLLSQIEGVEGVATLYLELDGVNYYDTIAATGSNSTLYLRMPRTLEEIAVKLVDNGRSINVPWNEFEARLSDQSTHLHAFRKTTQPLHHLYRLPTPRYQPLAEYTSLSTQFPVEYGINQYGIPASEPSEVKAKALQLKSYLLLFEQLMANYLSNVEHLSQLFSLDDDGQSYSFQLIGDETLKDASRIYPKDPEQALQQVTSSYDRYYERKSRLLDYLLSLYGEQLNQENIIGIDLYCGAHNKPQQLLKNKIAYLKDVMTLGRDRGAAVDYRHQALYDENVAGMQRRVSHMLGFVNHHARSLTLPLIKQGYYLLSNDEQCEETHELADQVMASYQKYFQQSGGAYKIDRRLLDEIEMLSERWLTDKLLQEGVILSNYKLSGLATSERLQLVFRSSEDEGGRWSLASYPNAQQATKAVHALRKLLVHLNQQSEGLHTIEHLLLRPRAIQAESEVADDFYDFRVSVLLPAWTARCSDSGFKMQAERLIAANTPAHIYPTIYWLSFSEMCQFEIYYKQWLDLLAEDDADSSSLDQAAMRLTQLLQMLEQKYHG